MAGADTDGALERRTLRKVKLYILAFIFVSQVFYQLCRNNIGFAQLTMGHEIGLNAQTFGLASGIFASSAFLMQVPLGFLYDRLNVRRVLTFNMAMWGLVVIAQAFVATGAQLTILRFFLGMFEGAFLPGAHILINIWFRNRDQGRATAFMMIGLAASTVVGNPFAGWMLEQHFFGISGWRNLFLVEGAVTFVWAILGLRILHDDPLKASWLRPDERAFMADYLATNEIEKNRHGALEVAGLWRVAADPRIILLLLSYLCAGLTTQTFGFFIPSLLKASGKLVSNQYVGVLAAVPYVAGATASYFWGRHGDRSNERQFHCVLPLLLAAAGVLFYPTARTPLAAMLLLAVLQIGMASYNVAFWPSCALVAGKRAMPKAATLIQAGNMIGSFLGPVCFGWSLDLTGNSAVGLYCCAATIVLNAVLMTLFFARIRVLKAPGALVEPGGEEATPVAMPYTPDPAHRAASAPRPR